MVKIQKQPSRSVTGSRTLMTGGLLCVLIVLAFVVAHRCSPAYDASFGISLGHSSIPSSSKAPTQCAYSSLSDLTEAERNPVAGTRHMVDPPKGGPLTLVCCVSTVGNMNIAVHHKWAPVGADHFVKMVKDGYFSSKVALFRCMKNFLCQFGIAGSPEWSKRYMAYAGGGKNSRSNQLIVSLVDVGSLAGGSPWEVPWGELVGTQSFNTLDKIYTGYGEKGPPQGLLGREGSSENVKKTWPLMDYITACEVVDEV
jgi:peptidyl-prolyl cis-trans isomerase A (cyclophilin A)